MDTDLFISVKQHMDNNTNSHSKIKSDDDNTSPASYRKVTIMQQKDRQKDPNMSEGSHRRPSIRGRRITIGGPDRDRGLSEEETFHGDNQMSGSRSKATSELVPGFDLESSSTHGRPISPSTKPAKRPYPPTSRKSSSTIESSASDAPEVVVNRQASVDSGFASMETITRKDKVLPDRMSSTERTTTTRTTSQGLHRTPSRRQYTITLSSPSPSAPTASSTVTKNRSSSITTHGTIQRSPLPEPEVAYSHTFYYTTCPHASPPKSRPLNVQPTLVPYRENLLSPPLSNLQEGHHRSAAPPSIYVLSGACSDCDISARRQLESEILGRFNHKLENLSIQLSILQKDIVTEHSDYLQNSDADAITAFSLPSTLDLAPESTQGILEIEDQFDNLIKQRDHEVKQMWKGFSARWGPGTTQIHRGDSVENSNRAHSRSTSRTTSSTASIEASTGRDTPGRSSTLSSATSTAAHKMPAPPSQPSRQISQSHSHTTSTRASSATSVRGRYSDGTYDVVVDPSVDGVESRGRMLVNWIRPGRKDLLGRARPPLSRGGSIKKEK